MTSLEETTGDDLEMKLGTLIILFDSTKLVSDFSFADN